MIVVDTSALMAIVLGEPQAIDCSDVLRTQRHIVISAGTLAETLIVAERRGETVRMSALLETFRSEIAPVTADTARQCAEAYARWGKGVHPAKLNLADCFAYALAQERKAPLLYVGDDFAQTDVASAIPRDDPSRK